MRVLVKHMPPNTSKALKHARVGQARMPALPGAWPGRAGAFVSTREHLVLRSGCVLDLTYRCPKTRCLCPKTPQ